MTEIEPCLNCGYTGVRLDQQIKHIDQCSRFPSPEEAVAMLKSGKTTIQKIADKYRGSKHLVMRLLTIGGMAHDEITAQSRINMKLISTSVRNQRKESIKWAAKSDQCARCGIIVSEKVPQHIAGDAEWFRPHPYDGPVMLVLYTGTGKNICGLCAAEKEKQDVESHASQIAV